MISFFMAQTLLGADSSDTKNSLRRKWRKLAKIHHPDLGGDPAMFVKITEAYRVLTDPHLEITHSTPTSTVQISGPVARGPRHINPYYWSDQEWLENEFGHLGWWNRNGNRRRS
jgi:hypothetical protein